MATGTAVHFGTPFRKSEEPPSLETPFSPSRHCRSFSPQSKIRRRRKPRDDDIHLHEYCIGHPRWAHFQPHYRSDGIGYVANESREEGEQWRREGGTRKATRKATPNALERPLCFTFEESDARQPRMPDPLPSTASHASCTNPQRQQRPPPRRHPTSSRSSDRIPGRIDGCHDAPRC